MDSILAKRCKFELVPRRYEGKHTELLAQLAEQLLPIP